MALRVSSLVYAPARLPRSQLPASLLDFARPQWKGKIAIAPTDSDFPPLVGAVIAKHGEAAARSWLAGLKRNARIYQDEEAVVAAVNRGDVATGVINSYYWYRLQLELGKRRCTARSTTSRPNDVGAAVNISGAAVLTSSKQQKNAERFVSFLSARRPEDHRGKRRLRIPRPPRRRTPNSALPPLARSATPRSVPPRSATASSPPA